MARMRISENELKKIIRESIEKVVNEDNTFPNTYAQLNQQFNQSNAGDERIGPGPSLTRAQADARNAITNAALSNWNSLGTVGQIKAIQNLVGAKPDGKLGPETLGKIYVALRKGENHNLDYVNFRPGKKGTYTNI